LPRSALLAAQPMALQHACLLAGGDDYELLFTAPATARRAVRDAAAQAGVAVTPIGQITAEAGLHVVDEAGLAVDLSAHRAFDHFRA